MTLLTDWIGRSETLHDTITPTPVLQMTATLDHAATRCPPAHRCRCCGTGCTSCPSYRHSEAGPDGHPTRGGFLPPVPLPRRMWAGSQFEFHHPIRVGDTVARTSTIHDVTVKDGRTGQLVFVKVRHTLHCNGAADPAITEFHDIVYRDLKKPGDVDPPPQAAPTGAPWQRDLGARRRAAVPLQRADLQRPPHPLRPALRHRGRGLPGPGRARPADRHAADGPAAPRGPRRRRGRFRFKAVRPTFDGHPMQGQRPARRQGPSSCGRRTTKAG
jgi:3-methylfumaryl-CoA hydratase